LPSPSTPSRAVEAEEAAAAAASRPSFRSAIAPFPWKTCYCERPGRVYPPLRSPWIWMDEKTVRSLNFDEIIHSLDSSSPDILKGCIYHSRWKKRFLEFGWKMCLLEFGWNSIIFSKYH
jgi:hypothetical protein